MSNTNISVDAFLSAGRPAEDIYRLEIVDAGVVDRTGQNGPYQQISIRAKLVERFGVGLLERPETEFLNCSLEGKGLGRFRSLYVAAMGEVPQGTVDPETGEASVSLDDLAKTLIGNESVWTTYYWRRDKETQEIDGTLGWSFSQDPDKLRAPKPLSEREAA